MSFVSKMTSIANNIRTLVGVSSPLGLDTMNNHLNNANTELDSQTSLLEQIATALEDKGSVGEGIVLPALNNEGTAEDIRLGKEFIDSAGQKVTGTIPTKGAATYTPTKTDQTISANQYLAGVQTIKGDANLLASNIKSGVSIFGITGNVAAKDTAFEASLIMRTASSIANQSVTIIPEYAFYKAENLVSVTFTACSVIESHAFQGATSLENGIFIACTDIKEEAFEGCSNLNGSNAHTLFTNVQTIGSSAFKNCTALTAMNPSFNKCTTIFENAFAGCTALAGFPFPSVQTVGSYAFQGCTGLFMLSNSTCNLIYDGAFAECTSLLNAAFPECTTIFENAFAGCTSLGSAGFPTCRIIHSGAFTRTALRTISLPSAYMIYPTAFANCTSLHTVILAGSSCCVLRASTAFTNTPIASGTGMIYVPASLVETYKSGTNWGYFSAQISAIENMPASALEE